jgi:ornithine--oxo-acid transaminase
MSSPVALEKQFGANNYHPLDVMLTKGKGVFVWDEHGKRYIDMMSAYSAVSHGHCHPTLVAALTHQANTLAVVSRAFYTDKLGAFLNKLCEITHLEAALPMNTGAEAVETALKAVRKWAYTIKKVPADQAEIIVCKGNFHGRTIAIVGMSTEAQYKDGFGPFPAGFKQIAFGDAQALEAAITPHTAAFLVEPIQGENGIIVPPEGYLKACAAICKKHNVLLICDEIQTGMGRTGKFLASDHDHIIPDGLILGKALGGGLLPVSVFLTRREVMDVFHPGDHGSTFGGNPLAAVVGLTALEVLFDENLIAKAAELGDYLITRLKNLKSSLIHDVRGRGLMVGLEIDSNYSARQLCIELAKKGILTKDTHKTVIRLAPPLVITKAQIDVVVDAIEQTLKEAETYTASVKSA